MIIPTLTINYIESMLIAKEKLNKKNSPKAYLTVQLYQALFVTLFYSVFRMMDLLWD